MKSSRLRWIGASAAAAAAVVVAGIALAPHPAVSRDDGPAGRPAGSATTTAPVGDALAVQIGQLQQKLRDNPGDAVSWATLGIDYVQQAKDTVDPMYYPKAEGALARSLRLGRRDNFVAMVGMANLRSAQHRFADALRWAERARAINPDNAGVYGALADAYTQLGRYGDAAVAVQRMVDLRPTAASLARASYVFELRGDVARARTLMRRALHDSATPAQQAFAYYYLGELAFNTGDPRTALRLQQQALRADPAYPDLLEGKAKAEAALGMRGAAVRDYAAVVSRVPQPGYVIEAGDYFTSIGLRARATQCYRLFTTENQLFTANGVRLDSDATLFFADHGHPAAALRLARVGIRARPFLDMADAYAWALHVNHRDRAASRWSHRARATGMRNALFAFHAGMIDRSLGHRAAARAELAEALRTNPYFSPLHARQARRALGSLGGRS